LLYALESNGATIEDGVLKLTDNANILGIMEGIYDAAEKSGSMLESDLASLADAIDTVIKNYATLITTGIEGKLTNV
jgi:hypothetical protein